MHTEGQGSSVGEVLGVTGATRDEWQCRMRGREAALVRSWVFTGATRDVVITVQSAGVIFLG